MQLSDDQIGEVLAVMGMEMTQSAFLKLIADNVRLVYVYLIKDEQRFSLTFM